MRYKTTYQSPVGTLHLAADEQALTGIWYQGSAHFCAGLDPDAQEYSSQIFADTAAWLDAYFAREALPQMPPLRLIGSEFQLQVWALLQEIPYGQSVTYGELAKEVACIRGMEKMSAQAVGGAVGRNRISILVPCHRVVGAQGKLTGYAGGMDRKEFLLALEAGK
ncbi:MAG: methylated-DNA--[protein]-cysteine S-methyltransferase [Actinomycetaceae bacterium]|nr:methylated-DNA--[protein]-cysteine S-methyltransferase [Actinomycetaceae bacterium]